MDAHVGERCLPRLGLAAGLVETASVGRHRRPTQPRSCIHLGEMLAKQIGGRFVEADNPRASSLGLLLDDNATRVIDRVVEIPAELMTGCGIQPVDGALRVTACGDQRARVSAQRQPLTEVVGVVVHLELHLPGWVDAGHATWVVHPDNAPMIKISEAAGELLGQHSSGYRVFVYP